MTAVWTRLNSLLLVLVMLGLLVVMGLLARGARGGPLDPPAPPASTDSVRLPGTPISSLPFTINSPGYYYLTRNLTTTISGNGITIDANNVTLDLNGFALVSSSLFPGSAITSGNLGTTYESLMVRNGVISGWDYGIQTENFIASAFEDLRVTHNYRGLYIGSGNTVRRVMSSYNQDAGLFIKQRGDAWGGQVTDTDLRKNGGAGMSINANNVHVSGNVIGVNSTTGVFVTGNFNEIIDNQIIGNDTGVLIFGSGENTVARNRFVHNVSAAVYVFNGVNNKVGTFVGDASLTTTNPWSNVVY